MTGLRPDLQSDPRRRRGAAALGAIGGLAALVALSSSATAQGFPALDPKAETILIGPGVETAPADTRGAWDISPGRVSPSVKRALKRHEWFPKADGARFADGFVRARFEAKPGVRATLMLRASHAPEHIEALSGYGLELNRTTARLKRWDKGHARQVVARARFDKATSLEVVAWMVGPHLQITVYHGDTLLPLASLALTDPRYPEGRVGVLMWGRGASKQALTLLTVRPAGRAGDVRDAPAGVYRYLAMTREAWAELDEGLASGVREMEQPRDRPDEVIVRTDAAGRERLVRAGIAHRWLDQDTPYKYVHTGYLAARDEPPEATRTGYRIDRTYKDAAMVEALLAAYQGRFPEIARLVEVGRTAGGRPLVALKISDHPERAEDEPAVFLNGSHHGNELLPVEFTLDAVQQLLEGYADDRRVRRWVDGLEIWCLPLVNPEGNYAFFERSIYAGRKNMRDTEGDGRWEAIDGVDLNRNYPFRWAALGEVGSRGYHRNVWYRGPRPASEAESRALMRLTDAEHFVASVSYHTVSNVILVPYTTDGVTSPTPNEAWPVARAIAAGLPAQPNGRRMRVDRQIYPVDGVDQDHFRAAHGTVALLVEGAYHNPESRRRRLKTIAATRGTWQGLLDRVLGGPGVFGRVTDGQGRPIAAEVRIVEQTLGQGEVWTSRCRDGRYDRLLAHVGEWTLEVRAPGYETVRQPVTAKLSGPVRVDVRLAAAPGAAPTAARLCGDPALLSIDHACACAVGECVQPGPPSWCRIGGVCVRAGARGGDEGGVCVPGADQEAWTRTG